MKLLDEKYRIVAVGRKYWPDQANHWVRLAYSPSVDAIVINDDCPLLDKTVDFITTYLDLDQEEREETRRFSDCSSLRGIMLMLDQVEEIRSKKKTA